MTYKLTEEFKEIIGSDPLFTVRAAVSPLFMVVTWQQGSHPLSVFSIAKGRDSWTALNEKNYISIATDRFRKYFSREISISDLEDEYYSWAKEVERLYNEVMSKDIKILSNSELESYFIKIKDLYLGLAQKTLYIENLDHDIIMSVIGEENREKLNTIWETATESTFVSFEGRQLKNIIDVLTSDSKNKVRDIKFIYTDYFWIKKDEEVKGIIGEIEKNLMEKKEEYEKVKINSDLKKEKYDKWIKTLDPVSLKITEYAQLVMHLRDIRKDPIAQILTMSAEISEEVVTRAGIDVKLAPFIILYEYMKGVDYITSIKNEIEGRSNGCIYLVNPDLSYKTENCDFDIATEEFNIIVSDKSEKSEELKGQIACKGNVCGVVRVIFDPHIDKGFMQGDILVTSMTRPEFVPIMKKAGAVVTNEGGITCHAAIVSRELGIPCIIGTKIATQVLKDGDMVEVDANNGVVRIIK